jgi:hypothetical protein
VTGKVAPERAGLTCNKNGIPFDPEKPTITSGIRPGTPVGTSRGFGIKEFEEIGGLIARVLISVAKSRRERLITQPRGEADIPKSSAAPGYWLLADQQGAAFTDKPATKLADVGPRLSCGDQNVVPRRPLDQQFEWSNQLPVLNKGPVEPRR